MRNDTKLSLINVIKSCEIEDINYDFKKNHGANILNGLAFLRNKIDSECSEIEKDKNHINNYIGKLFALAIIKRPQKKYLIQNLKKP